jgi:acetyltransferase-like isoleucine patch superfamily enzyme
MKLVFDYKMLEHINQSAIKENGHASWILLLVQKILINKLIVYVLGAIEHVVSFIMTLPIPIYSSIIYAWITNSRGLPYISGMYIRGLYYRNKLGHMDPNVFIDQGVFFAYPKTVHLREFSYIDKNVTFMSRSAKVGRRVHIAPNVFVSAGGDFEIEDYACVATKSSIITSTEILKDGARCSGPMVSADQRNVLRGKVLIKKDAFIGASTTILPNVVVEIGSVIAAGVTLSKTTEPWGIYVGARPQKISQRAPVLYPDN